jgi:hypothetical protein
MTDGRSAATRIVAELIVLGPGLALLACAWRIDLRWFQRHTAATGAALPLACRAAVLLVGLAVVVLARPRAGRWAARVGAREAAAASARIAVAFVAALVASEIGLRALKLPARCDMAIAERRLGERVPRYGWLFRASKSFTVEADGRPVRYDFDADHDRAPSVDYVPDPQRPSLLFVGESVTAGHGLAWAESFPAIVGEEMDLQVVDLGVDGYASDQAFLRLVDALPRFAHPVAVITCFMPGMVDRMERVDHPRLRFDEPGMWLEPPGWLESSRLAQAFREGFVFRSEGAIDTTAEIFRRTARLANERGARAIFVALHLGTDWPPKAWSLVDDLLVRPGYTVIAPRFGFEPIPGDVHPNVASTRRLAQAVTAALGEELRRR